MENFQERWKEWQVDPDKYWAKVARRLQWEKEWENVVEADQEVETIKRFVGGKLSLCYNCLDKHVEDGFGNKTAIIAESFYTKQSKLINFKELLDEVSRLAGALHNYGLNVGDNVLIHLPMIPEALIAILATCRLGAVYTAVSQGQTSHIIKERIEEVQPKIIFTTNCGFNDKGQVSMKNILDEILKTTYHKPTTCIVVQRGCAKPAALYPDRDISWSDALKKAKPHPCVMVEANHPLLILFTSGSTGKPKGILHSVGGMAVGMMKDDLEGFQYNNGHAFWGMSHFAWIGGQFAVCFGPLLGKTATVIYEKSFSNPDVNDVCRILSAHKITHAFIPTNELRGFRKMDPTGEIATKYRPFCLTNVVTAGTALDFATCDYMKKIYNTHVLQLYGQTEILAFTTFDMSNGRQREDCPQSSVGKPSPGWLTKILRDDGTEAEVEEIGNIVIKLPVPPGVMLGVYKNENMFKESYLSRFAGYYDTKDEGKFDSEGYLYISSRSDSVFKLNGTRYSCDGIEKVMLEKPFVNDCCVVLKITDNETEKIYQPYGFYTIIKDLANVSDLNREVKEHVVGLYGADVACLQVFEVKILPITITGKASRSVIQAIVNNNYDAIKESQSSTDEGILCIREAIK